MSAPETEKPDTDLSFHTFTNEEKHNLSQIVAAFALYTIQEMRIEFSGYGDDGQVDGVTITPDPSAGEHIIKAYPRQSRHFDHSKKEWVIEPAELEELELGKVVEQIGEVIARDCPTDWCNNEGGMGCVVFQMHEGAPAIHFECGYNETYVEPTHDSDTPIKEILK